ncbi:uncharacterized protein LOC131808229 [Mustela lutreola]|uniref:uncharacterized protein LOC131808229 n=1 Tax=Mustela lutreola TaxID=9666 RepID=UPI0027979982|nr:uncharacterized protein LOC131808229 [Mustela lutreola]
MHTGRGPSGDRVSELLLAREARNLLKLERPGTRPSGASPKDNVALDFRPLDLEDSPLCWGSPTSVGPVPAAPHMGRTGVHDPSLPVPQPTRSPRCRPGAMEDSGTGGPSPWLLCSPQSLLAPGTHTSASGDLEKLHSWSRRLTLASDSHPSVSQEPPEQTLCLLLVSSEGAWTHLPCSPPALQPRSLAARSLQPRSPAAAQRSLRLTRHQQSFLQEKRLRLPLSFHCCAASSLKPHSSKLQAEEGPRQTEATASPEMTLAAGNALCDVTVNYCWEKGQCPVSEPCRQTCSLALGTGAGVASTAWGGFNPDAFVGLLRGLKFLLQVALMRKLRHRVPTWPRDPQQGKGRARGRRRGSELATRPPVGCPDLGPPGLGFWEERPNPPSDSRLPTRPGLGLGMDRSPCTIPHPHGLGGDRR